MPEIWKGELGYFVLLGFILVFLGINYNLQLYQIYIGMLLVSYFMEHDVNWISFPISKKVVGWFKAFAVALIAYALFIVTSTIVFKILSSISYFAFLDVPKDVTFASINSFIAASQPVLAASVFVSIFTFGVLIPFVESIMFPRGFEWMAHKFNINYTSGKFKDWKLVWMVVFISALFVIYHLTAKGITNNASLIVTFIFMFYNMALVLIFRELKQGILLHVISNTYAMLAMHGFL